MDWRESTANPLSRPENPEGNDRRWTDDLHPELLVLPKDIGEFVIVHELVHLLAPNHGKVFKLFLDAYLPGWEEKEWQLQVYSIAESN